MKSLCRKATLAGMGVFGIISLVMSVPVLTAVLFFDYRGGFSNPYGIASLVFAVLGLGLGIVCTVLVTRDAPQKAPSSVCCSNVLGCLGSTAVVFGSVVMVSNLFLGRCVSWAGEGVDEYGQIFVLRAHFIALCTVYRRHA
jgi:hypothetical protein